MVKIQEATWDPGAITTVLQMRSNYINLSIVIPGPKLFHYPEILLR